VSDTVRLVYRHFPLQQHDKARIAAQAAEAAALQDKFWEMHDLLYEKQGEWKDKPVAEITATFKAYAQQLGLDLARFERDLASSAVAARVQRDLESGEAAGVNGTPFTFLDGNPIEPQAFQDQNVGTALRGYAAQRAQAAASLSNKAFSFDRPEQVIDKAAKYVMTVKTTRGDIVAELDPALAPVNVNAIVFLIQKGYFENAPVLLNDARLGAVLTGSPIVTGNPGFECSVETKPGLMAQPGVVALFGDNDSSAAQFIFTYSPTQALDNQFSVIGRITSGLDVVRALTAAEGDKQGDKITAISVAEKK